ncbi:MAG: GNAT family N-acetyltransferase [Oscillospiraceae bacterium]|nr:GNAT family N-acetyltransferase [Oscillospiraceae bacterium]
MTEIRIAGEADIPALVRLRLAYFDEEFGTLPEETDAHLRMQLPQFFAEHLNRDCFGFLASAEPGGAPCASAILCCSAIAPNPRFPDGKRGYVLGVYTEPEHRGKGCATLLMQRLLQEAKRLGLNLVSLSASDMGRPIYEKLGFTVSHSHFTEMELALP